MQSMNNYFLVVLLLIISSSAQPNWEWVSPKPQGNTLNSCFVTDSFFIAIGENSTIMKSLDNGENWEVKHSIVNDGRKLFDLNFPNSQIGFACGEAGKIIKTTDSGSSWTNTNSPTTTSLKSIYFPTPTVGWCGGFYGELYKTNDGGNSWVRINTGSSQYIYKIQFVDTLHGYIASSTSDSLILLKTIDGGQNWIELSVPSKPFLRSLFFINQDSGWVVGDWGTVLYTKNGGDSWEIQMYDSTDYYASFNDIFFINADTGWAVGPNNIKTTFNGGVNWYDTKSVSYPQSYPFTSVYGSSSSNVWVTGEQGQIYKSEDGGNNWINKQWRLSNTYLKDVFFYNDSIGWTFDNDENLFKTTNSGREWINIAEIYGDRIFFVSRDTGFIIYWNYVSKTIDGGMHWTKVNTNIEKLYDLYFINDSIGWAVGRYGGIVKTVDGGETWIEKNSSVSYSLTGVFFINKKIGWATGGSGGILKTVDGGETWNEIYYNDYFYLWCLYFTDSLNGWVAGQFDALLHTSDGGDTWEQQFYNSGYGIKDIKFIDGIGYAVGESYGNPSIVIQSVDNGLTWKNLDIGAALTFYGVHFTSKDNGWIVGRNGTIMHTTNGSVTSISRNKKVLSSTDISLFQNYPNPFNSRTVIKFILPTTTKVTISIYNLLGQTVDVLLDDIVRKGTHEVVWNADKLSSGVYFYNIKSKDINATKKLVLIK